MYKYILAALVTASVYFLFLSEPYPNSLDFRGITFASKVNNNNSQDKGIDIFRYSDKSGDHVFMFAIMNDTSTSLKGLSDHYLKLFKGQGYKFKQEDSRYIGINADNIIYLTRSKSFEGLAMFATTVDPLDSNGRSNDDTIFMDLEFFTISK